MDEDFDYIAPFVAEVHCPECTSMMIYCEYTKRFICDSCLCRYEFALLQCEDEKIDYN